MSPLTTIARAMEVITDELWIIAVKMAPSRTSRIGLPIWARKILTPSRLAKSFIEPLISERPTKSIPKPASMPPIVFQLLLLEKRDIKAPSPAKAEKITEVEMPPSPNIPRATICAVTVVPMFAPYIIVAACAREMMPALTKPMVITVVAPELWIAAVPRVPIPTPSSLLLDAFAKRCLSFSELAASRLELII